MVKSVKKTIAQTQKMIGYFLYSLVLVQVKPVGSCRLDHVICFFSAVSEQRKFLYPAEAGLKKAGYFANEISLKISRKKVSGTGFLIKILFYKRLKRSNLPHKIIAQVRVGEKNMRSQQYVVKQIVIVYVVYDQNQRYFIVSKIVIDNLHELCFFLLFSVIILERKIIQDDERSGG
jgi:hypothetical protein